MSSSEYVRGRRETLPGASTHRCRRRVITHIITPPEKLLDQSNNLNQVNLATSRLTEGTVINIIINHCVTVDCMCRLPAPTKSHRWRLEQPYCLVNRCCCASSDTTRRTETSVSDCICCFAVRTRDPGTV